MNVTQWHGCYSDSWQGVITPDAFAHPAKYARGLIRRIYQHMLDSGYVARGDSIIDPFGGVALGGLDAMTFGLHWTGCELEPRFVELGNRNIDKWRRDLAMLNGTLGTARLIQGDSRRLLEVVGMGMGAAVSSPPFGDQNDHERPLDSTRNKNGRHTISLPYGDTAGNIGILRADSAGFTAAVSSPPYADAVNGSGEGPGARHDPIYHNGDNARKISSDNGYGTTPGNVGHMRDAGFEAAVSSPPFAGTSGGKGEASQNAIDSALFARHLGSMVGTFDTQGNLGNLRADDANLSDTTKAAKENLTPSPDNFWAAARAIVEQTYAALRPGGYAAWVCKDFVRKGQRVPFSDQWQQLCAAVGFEPVERIAAMLVADHGDQLDIFGGATARLKERKSFFRRLAEKKGSPRIDHEDVIIMRKPTRAHANGNGARSNRP